MRKEQRIERILGYYWFFCLLKLVKSESLSRFLKKWAERLLPEERKTVSVAIDGKSNEILAVQELLKELDISGYMVVADALNCQREPAEAIVRGKGGYLLDAKGNQPVLEKEIREYVQDESLRKTLDCESATEKTGIGWKCGLHTLQQI